MTVQELLDYLTKAVQEDKLFSLAEIVIGVKRGKCTTDYVPLTSIGIRCEANSNLAKLAITCNIVKENEYQIATELGPTNNSKCPQCGNSFQNGKINGILLRCASCKLVFERNQHDGNYEDWFRSKTERIV